MVGVGAADSMLGMVGVGLFGRFPRALFAPLAPGAAFVLGGLAVPSELGEPRVFVVLVDGSIWAKRNVGVASKTTRRHEVAEVSRHMAKRGVFIEYGVFIPISLVSCQSVYW